MSDLIYDLPDRQLMPQVWKGRIAQQPINFTAKVGVVLPDMHPDLVFEEVRWQARDNMSLPEFGDNCLVIFDNNREPWVVAWWPAVRNPQVFISPLSSPPSSPVDGDIWIATGVGLGTARWFFQYTGSVWAPVGSSALTAQQPGCRLTNVGGAQTVAANTITWLTFDTERWDADNMHSLVSNTGRITINTAGVYDVGAGVEIVPGSACIRLIAGIRINGGSAGADAMRVDLVINPNATNPSYLGASTLNPRGTWKFSANDYIELYVYQSSSASGSVSASGGAQDIKYSPEFWAQRIGA